MSKNEKQLIDDVISAANNWQRTFTSHKNHGNSMINLSAAVEKLNRFRLVKTDSISTQTKRFASDEFIPVWVVNFPGEISLKEHIPTAFGCYYLKDTDISILTNKSNSAYPFYYDVYYQHTVIQSTAVLDYAKMVATDRAKQNKFMGLS